MESMDGGTVIRAMEECDIPKIMPIELDSFGDPWSAHAFADELRLNPQCSFYVACDPSSEVQGYAGLWWNSELVKLLKIAVREDARQLGIGSLLMNQVIAEATDRNVRFIELEVAASNKKAQRFYEKHGFEQTGIIAEFYERGPEDALLYQKR